LAATFAQPSRSVTIRFEAPSEIETEMDAGQVQQALVNLVMNAVEASSLSLISLTISRSGACPSAASTVATLCSRCRLLPLVALR